MIPLQTMSLSDLKGKLSTVASALRQTPEYMQFKATGEALQNDAEAQQAITTYREKQQSLQMMLMLNSVSDTDRAELQRLEAAVYESAVIQSYLTAQENFMVLCQAVNDRLSRQIGMQFAIRRGGCC